MSFALHFQIEKNEYGGKIDKVRLAALVYNVCIKKELNITLIISVWS